MSIVIIILLIIAGFFVLLLLLALFMKKEHYVKREILINAPRQKIFDYLKLLKNQDNFNRGAMAGEDRNKEYRGTDGTVGFIYAWSGNKDAGEGEKEIMNLVEGKRVEMQIRFKKPMVTSSNIVMEMESISATQTRMSWSNAGSLRYPVNILIPMMEKMLPKDMDASLVNLKNILEKE